MENRTIDGLALSGGGFRAALFHIGVLARLAELDLLRQIEVLSTVSGGSLIGVRYFLHVKELLETSADHAIGKQDYIDIVDRMSREFLKDIQKDLRARAYGRLNVLKPSSETFGMLCETYLYERSRPKTEGLARNGTRLLMTDLKIKRKGGPNAKAPDLWINATSLTTGQQWVFTPTMMGTITGSERPSLGLKLYEDTGDTPSELAALLMCLEGTVEYSKLSPALKAFPVGRAVAASACVPGIFPPITLGFKPFPRLRAGIHLVDGGVIDNLGLRPLEKCGSTLVSDASAVSSPNIQGDSKSALIGLWVSFGALLTFSQAASSRLWTELRARNKSEADSIDVCVSLPKFRGKIDGVADSDSFLEAIRSIRTDLDLFTDIEGYALMYAGYQIAGSEIASSKGFRLDKTEPWRWPFLVVTGKLNQNSGKLKAARSRLKLVRILYSNVARMILAVLLWLGLHPVAVRLFPGFAQQENGLFFIPKLLIGAVVGLVVLLLLAIPICVVAASLMAATSWMTFLLGRVLKWRDELNGGGLP